MTRISWATSLLVVLFLSFVCFSVEVVSADVGAAQSSPLFAQASSQSTQIPAQVPQVAMASRGNTFNPDIGVNGLILFRNSNKGHQAANENANGLALQEAEIQFSSDVDPYWRFVSAFALHQEFDATTAPPSSEYVFEPEEVFAESLALPLMTLRVGKFKAAFGRHNLLHAHAFPFVDAPLAHVTLLGEEGLNDVGFSLAAFFPLPWFSEVTLQSLSGRGEGLEYFQSPSANNRVSVIHLKNLWDLSDDMTLEWGVSSANGQNSYSKTTEFLGSDLTVKWRASPERALIASMEWLERTRPEATNEKGMGGAAWVQYQFSRRWWVEARGEYLEVKDQDPAALEPHSEFQRKQSLLVGFIPSEFSGLRLQYDHHTDGSVKAEQRILLQMNYSIGAHAAHAY